MTADSEEKQLRVDLAATFRIVAKLDMHEAVANHFSVVLSDNKHVLIQRAGQHFSLIKAKDLLLLDINSDAQSLLERKTAPDPTAWFLHSHLHRNLPHARAILHVHARWSLTLCCLEKFEFLMLEQNACRFFNRVAYDRSYSGMALNDEEGERVAKLFGDDKSVLMCQNHGIFVVGKTIAEAFDELYYFEKACEIQVRARQIKDSALKIIPDDIAAYTERQWNECPTNICDLHFSAQKEILDRENSDYSQLV